MTNVRLYGAKSQRLLAQGICLLVCYRALADIFGILLAASPSDRR